MEEGGRHGGMKRGKEVRIWKEGGNPSEAG